MDRDTKRYYIKYTNDKKKHLQPEKGNGAAVSDSQC